MKIHEVIERAQKDPRYVKRLQELGRQARDEGMESRAFKTLARELVSNPVELDFVRTTAGYSSALQFTLSNLPVAGKDLCEPVRWLPLIGTSTGYPVITTEPAAVTPAARGGQGSGRKTTGIKAAAKARTGRSSTPRT